MNLKKLIERHVLDAADEAKNLNFEDLVRKEKSKLGTCPGRMTFELDGAPSREFIEEQLDAIKKELFRDFICRHLSFRERDGMLHDLVTLENAMVEFGYKKRSIYRLGDR